MANALRGAVGGGGGGGYGDSKGELLRGGLGNDLKSFSLDQLSLGSLGQLSGLQFLNQSLQGLGGGGGGGLLMSDNSSGMATAAYDYSKPMQHHQQHQPHHQHHQHQHQQQQQQQQSSHHHQQVQAQVTQAQPSLASLFQSSLSSNSSPSLSDLLLGQNPHALMTQLAQMKGLGINFQGLALQMQQQYAAAAAAAAAQSAFPLPVLNGSLSGLSQQLGMAGLAQPSTAAAMASAIPQPPSSSSSTASSSSSSATLPSSRALPGLNGLSVDAPHYKCTHSSCGQVLKSRFSLKRHMKKHTGEKNHNCPFKNCHRKFSETTALKRHARIHTGEKPVPLRLRRLHQNLRRRNQRQATRDDAHGREAVQVPLHRLWPLLLAPLIPAHPHDLPAQHPTRLPPHRGLAR